MKRTPADAEPTYNRNPIERKRTFDVSAIVSTYYFPFKPHFDPHWEKYDFTQIFLILEGEGTYRTENGTYHFSPGMMLYRPAHHASIYEWETEEARLGLIGIVCNSEALEHFGEAPILLMEEEQTSLLDLIRTTVRISEDLKETGDVIGMRIKPDTPDVVLDFISASIERFLCMLYCRLCGIEFLVDESQKANKYIDKTTLVESVTRYMEAKICEQLTVRKISAHFGVSPTTLMKRYRAETGMGLIEAFNVKKIDEAKRLIRRSSLSFSQISEHLGFSTPNYFTRVFRAHEGITPTAYSKFVSKRNAGV